MMIAVRDRVRICDDGLHRARKTPIMGLTLHMFGVSGIHDAAGIARFYRMNKQWTHGQMPYTYVVDAGGTIEVALPERELGPHALAWSSSTLGIACLGDFNKHQCSDPQWTAAVRLAVGLCQAHQLEPSSVMGHTERPGATSAKGKVCPGRFWSMPRFREEIAVLMDVRHELVVT